MFCSFDVLLNIPINIVKLLKYTITPLKSITEAYFYGQFFLTNIPRQVQTCKAFMWPGIQYADLSYLTPKTSQAFVHDTIQSSPLGILIHVFTNFVVDINECNTGTPCLNGGVCSNTAGSFTCNCTGTGYQGDTCQNG